jgi:hypothetical protein
MFISHIDARFALLRFPYSDMRSLPRQLPFLVRYNTVISVPLEVTVLDGWMDG